MWIGTKDGLCRFDGYDFKVFRNDPADSLSLGNSSVRTLLCSKDGTLYIGTDDGAYRKSPRGFERLKDIHGAVNAIFEAPSGELWFGGKDIYSINGGTTTSYSPLPELSPTIWNIVRDKRGEMWFSTMNGVLLSLKQQSGEISSHAIPKDGEVNALYYDPLGDCLLLGTLVDGLYRYDIETNSFTLLLKDFEGKRLLNIHSIISISSEDYLVGCDNGILKYSRSGSCEKLDCEKFTSRDNASIFCLFIDSEGGLWAGTYYYGILYLRPNYKAIEPFEALESLGSGKSIVSCFAQSCEGEVWVGTNNRGLLLYDPESSKVSEVALSKGHSNLKSVWDNGEELWIGYYHSGIERYSHQGGKLTLRASYSTLDKGLSHNSIYSIFRTSEGSLYAGTQSGLDLYDPLKDRFESSGICSGTRVYDLQEDPAGILWIASASEGLLGYNPKTGKVVKYSVKEGLPSNTVISLALDKQMNVYCATLRGLAVLRRDTDTVERLLGDFGPLSSLIAYVAIDDEGFLWASTNSGVFRIEPESLRVKQYSKGDGLQSNQFNENAGLLCSDGTLLLGGVNGFNAIRPSLLNWQSPYQPKLSLDVPYSLDKDGSLRVKEKDAKLSFDAAVLSYYSPENNLCSYIMEGMDKAWSTGMGKQHIQYNLPSGKYTLRVQGLDAGGKNTLEEKVLHINVLPPFYLSKWMIVLYALLLFGATCTIVFLVFRHQRGEHQNELLQLEARKNKEISDNRTSFFSNIIYELTNPVSRLRSGLEELDYVPEQVSENVGELSELLERLREFKEVGDEGKLFSHSEEDAPEEEEYTPTSEGKLLLVNRNKAQEEFLSNALGDIFSLVSSETLEKGIFDLVIFDEDVPEVYALFNRLRSDESTCDVPAILLSSRSDEKFRKKALERGFDSIVEKPISTRLLLSQIDNLIRSRKAIRELYRNSPLLPAQSLAHSSKDVEFINKVNAAINANLSESEDISGKVADALNMSKVNFRKKLSAISGMPPLRYINLVRLKKAAELLRSTDLKVSEIGYKVGFATPSYFAKCFTAEFGVLPKDYRK